MTIDQIKQSYVNKTKISKVEAAKAIATDAEMLFSYLMDNNPVAINKILKLELGYNDLLPFAPDRKAMGGIISGLISKNDKASLQKIINGFVKEGFNENANNYTTDRELRLNIKKHF